MDRSSRVSRLSLTTFAALWSAVKEQDDGRGPNAFRPGIGNFTRVSWFSTANFQGDIMTHKPAIPPASTPPYPAHPAPHAESTQADPPFANADKSGCQDKSPASVTALGAAIGIGSAAIVAALLYAKRRKA
ncbi:hypothetical protein GCM10019071_05490 [Sphingobium fuliginis]|uniref:Uncharacterized protein n=1 Tax=Sphingobium fuliginis (strain ATCC 27551) TaxID=336203 RepID=A0ABQ1EN78_SPHSA|nr:hypothetical protein GCM10019071_05490 [Sphingobium fuliginis]